jgi:hypothetical protein
LPYNPDSFVILIYPVEEMEPLDIVVSQMQELWYDIQFKTSDRFIFVVTGYFVEMDIFQSIIHYLWLQFKISNLVIMITRPDSQGCDVNEDMYGSVNTTNIDIFSWFPYKGDDCADNFDVVLMDQCGCENIDTDLHNVSLFTNKIPNKFAGCPATAYLEDVAPYVMLTDNFTDLDGRTVLRFSGIVVKYLSLVTEALNLRLKYCAPQEDCGDEYSEPSIIVFVGFNVLTKRNFNQRGITIPYIFDTVKWFVPCAKPALRMDKIMNLFSSSIWITMLLVILLIALVFWSSVRLLLGAVLKESYGYRTVVHCLYNVWCVFMGVSVPEMPKTWRVRALFVLFVWYTFAMSTIFGSFFTSFLVSPGYVPRISTLNDLNQSDLKHGMNKFVYNHLSDVNYMDNVSLKLDVLYCADPDACMERTFTQSDTTFVATTFMAQYVASKVGKTTGKILVCSLDEYVFSSNAVITFNREHPVTERFNTVIRRCIEAGLGDKYWSDLLFNLTLQNMRNSEESDCQNCSVDYFVFSLSHLRVAFIALGFGYVLSVAVFVAELICNWLSKRRTVTVIT